MCRAACQGGRRCDNPGPGRDRHNARRRALYAAAAATRAAAAHDPVGATDGEDLDERLDGLDSAAAQAHLERLLDDARTQVAHLAAFRTTGHRGLPEIPDASDPSGSRLWQPADAERAVTAVGYALDARIDAIVEAATAGHEAAFLEQMSAKHADAGPFPDRAAWVAYGNRLVETQLAIADDLEALYKDAPPYGTPERDPWLLRLREVQDRANTSARVRAGWRTDEKDLTAARRRARVEAGKVLLEQVRPFGAPAGGHPFHEHSQKPASAEVTVAIASFPTAWVEASMRPELPKLRVVRTRGRAHYIHRDSWSKATRGPVRCFSSASDASYLPKGAKNITGEPGRYSYTLTMRNGSEWANGSTLTTDGSLDTPVHEFSHRVEYAHPLVVALEAEFLERRCAGESLVRYNGRRTELTTPDSFVNTYVGKRYNGDAYEVLSMGMEAVMCGEMGGLVGDDGFKEDRDHRAFILGCLAAA